MAHTYNIYFNGTFESYIHCNGTNNNVINLFKCLIRIIFIVMVHVLYSLNILAIIRLSGRLSHNGGEQPSINLLVMVHVLYSL